MGYIPQGSYNVYWSVYQFNDSKSRRWVNLGLGKGLRIENLRRTQPLLNCSINQNWMLKL